MNDLFGISMTLIMYVLLGLLAAGISTVLLVAVRNRVMFKIGVRNIPRRRAQTILIVLGLMLSTLIISAAFTTGDTVDRSITSEVYSVLGSLDESIQVRAGSDQTFEDNQNTVTRDETFSEADARTVATALAGQPLIDAVIPVYSDIAVAVNQAKGQSSPLFTIAGLDPAAARDIPDVEDLNGHRLTVDALAPGEIYVNQSAADELEAKAGDSITVFAHDKATQLRIRAVVKDRRLAGAAGVSIRRQGGVLPLATAQEIFAAPGRVTLLAVSNKGDSREGLDYADQVEAQIKATLQKTQTTTTLAVSDTKRRGVDIAEQGANVFTTFFLVLGLFSIGAGVLLIFMIFVMLAAERKPEMGMARAVGTKRADLVQTFLSEGMAYNVVAAMVGSGLGVLVAFVMAKIMASLFSRFDLNISPHVTLRSLIVSYSLGVVLTFFTVTFSSWRVSNINIVRAIRDIPEPPMQKPLWRAHGFFSTLGRLIFRPGGGRSWAIRAGLLVFGTLLVVAGISSGATAVKLAGVIFGGLAIAGFVALTFQTGLLFVVAGVPLVMAGSSGGQMVLLYAGISLVPLGLALLIRSFGANDRLVYTSAGLLMLYVWEFDYKLRLVEKIFGKTEGNIEMFFLSGVMVTVAATFVVVYNSDLLLGVVTRLGRGLGALVPSIKMAVAYPLANKMRTGMTMAMFCLVVFALIVMSSMNFNFNNIFLSDRALGGWDVIVDESPTNQIADLPAALAAANSPAASKIDAVGITSIATRNRGRACQLENGKTCDAANLDKFERYPVRGEDPGFLKTAAIHLQSRARGYDGDEAVWQSVARDPSLAVVDANSLAGAGGFGSSGFIQGIDARTKELDPVTLVLADRAGGAARTVKVIGVIELGSSNTYAGIHVSKTTFDAIFAKPDVRRFFLKTTPGADNLQVARDIEAALLTTGAQAESLRHQVDQQSATFTGFFQLMQGFMGLGLFVGVAAVGVISFRTVVERRQQIGMLRALGYTRNMIGLTFLIESAFIAFMGVTSGIVFALILARRLILEQFANQGATTFVVPWAQVALIGGLAFGFALLMTLIPSRQAASIPIARALRYE